MKARGSLFNVRLKETSVVRPRRKVEQGGKQGHPGWEPLPPAALRREPRPPFVSRRCSGNGEQGEGMEKQRLSGVLSLSSSLGG